MAAQKKYKLQVPMNIDLKKKAEKNAKRYGLSSVQEYIRFLIHNNNDTIILPLNTGVKNNNKNKTEHSNAKKVLEKLMEAKKTENIWTNESGLNYQKKIRKEWNKR